MKNMLHTLARLSLFAVLMLPVVVSCQSAIDDEATDPTTPSSFERYKVKVITRSATSSSSIAYPVTVNAISSTGDIVARQQIESASESLSLSLPEGDYTLVAISGSRSMPDGYATVPTMTGKTRVSVSGSSVSANIIMGYAVARLDISLSGLPASVSDATVTFSPLYESLSEAAEYTGESQAVIPLKHNTDGTWTTGTVYVMPSAKAETVMTVTMNIPGQTPVAYGIAYHEGLRASVPYSFKGVFSGEQNSDVEVTGTLSCGDWSDVVEGEFSFGPTGDNAFGGSTGGSTASDVITVASLPLPGTLCGGHLVASIDDDGDALLMSTAEWDGLTSAYNEDDPDVPIIIAESYAEGDMPSWRIPTADEATTLMKLWGGEQADVLNATLKGAGLTPVTSKEPSTGNNARYLCSHATQTFSFAAGAKMATAGRTVKTYRLRLVKSVRYVIG